MIMASDLANPRLVGEPLEPLRRPVRDCFNEHVAGRARTCRRVECAEGVLAGCRYRSADGPAGPAGGCSQGCSRPHCDTAGHGSFRSRIRACEEGVQFHDLLGVWIAGSGGDNSIINGVGGPVTSTNPGKVEPVDLVSYP